jgi:DNA invertase Pin-like site-specific DNA recombinase
VIVGYARTSRDDAGAAIQLAALQAAGCDEIVHEDPNSPPGERIALERLLENARRGDELVVWRLDRIGRSLTHLVKLIGQLNSQDIGFRSLVDQIDTRGPSGPYVEHLFAALVRFERDLHLERAGAGQTHARTRGRKGGRKSLAREKLVVMHALWDSKTMTADAIAAQLGIHRATVFKYVKNRA